jgi:hypothetical protein
MQRFALSAGLALVAASYALAAPSFQPSIGQPGDPFELASAELLEARFRADTTNWNLRLENNGSPSAGDNQSNLANGIGAFRDRSFDFELSYSAALDRVLWSVSRDAELSGSLVYDASSFDSFNAIQFSTGASRATVTVDDLVFSGLGVTQADWPNLSASSTGTAFRQTNLVFGGGTNLLSEDWSLSGRVSFADFTHDNPSEGARVNIRLVQASVIPSPSGMASIALAAGWCLIRRRRG